MLQICNFRMDLLMLLLVHSVIPMKMGIQIFLLMPDLGQSASSGWIPAFAGMTTAQGAPSVTMSALCAK